MQPTAIYDREAALSVGGTPWRVFLKDLSVIRIFARILTYGLV